LVGQSARADFPCGARRPTWPARRCGLI